MLAKGTTANTTTPIAAPTDTPAFDELIVSYTRSLVAQGLAAGSVERYVNELRLVRAFVSAHDLPRDPRALGKADLEAYFSAELARRTAHTVKCGYIIIGAFFGWLLAEEEITVSPLAHMKAPRTPPVPPAPVLPPEAISAILKTCAGNTFTERRDLAILRTLLDTGLRRAELAALIAADIDLNRQTIRVRHGKGDKPRTVFLGAKAVRALDRYTRARPTHPHAALPQFWLSERGALSAKGVYELVGKRALQAGLPDVYTHLFRHTWAHLWRDAGGSDSDLMTMAGWSSLAMAGRYGASAQVARAQKAHKLFSPGDRF